MTLTEILMILLRYALFAAAAKLVDRHILTPEQGTVFATEVAKHVAVVLTAGGLVIWALLSRYWSNLKIKMALDLPAGSTHEELKDAMPKPSATVTKILSLVAIVAVSVGLTACAAKGVRNQSRVGALSVGEAVLALDHAEQQLAAASIPGYDMPAQKAVGAGILKVIHAARAYERAAKDYPVKGPVPQQLADAKVGINHALDDLVAAVPAIAGVREPLLRAVNVLRAALTSSSAEAGSLPVVRAQAIPPQIAGLFALANLFVGLIGSGRSTFERLKATLQKEGATDEELDALDLRLSEAIARREEQQAEPSEG